SAVPPAPSARLPPPLVDVPPLPPSTPESAPPVFAGSSPTAPLPPDEVPGVSEVDSFGSESWPEQAKKSAMTQGRVSTRLFMPHEWGWQRFLGSTNRSDHWRTRVTGTWSTAWPPRGGSKRAR